MTNRDKLLSMSLYDMLVSMNTSGECCVIDSLGGIIEVVPQRCDHYANCSKCIEDFLNEGGNTKMYVGKKWMTETEVQAYIAELEAKNAEVEEKRLAECRQISEYDAEVKQLKKFLGCIRNYYRETISWDELFEKLYRELVAPNGDKFEMKIEVNAEEAAEILDVLGNLRGRRGVNVD
ncbi:MAG: hypothetical protein IKG98_11560 [Ruminococcus sp.]|nr:hypothetical protein [Ruminococcus sp.]